MLYQGFIGPSNQVQGALADCERLMNLYVEPADAGTGRPALYPVPGQQRFASVTDIGARALFTMNARALALMGTGVYEVFANGTTTKYGIVVQDSNLGQITMNGVGGNQAGIASGSNFYSLDLSSNALSAAILTGEATQIGMIDGYGVAFNRTIGKIRLSDLNDFTTWDPTQFALRSSAPDNWQAMLVNAPDVWLIGEQTGDVWYDAGTFPFPLAPRPGATFKYGIAATFSIAAAGDSVFWLSRNAEGAGIVVRARGYVPQPISTYALETAIADYQRTSTIADAEALVYQKAGHTFYVLRFPAANATWVYDLRTNEWHERGKWVSAQGRYNVWSPRVVTYAFGQHLVGDVTSGTIATLDETFGTELDGSAIRRLRIPPALFAEDGGRIYLDRFELGIEPGLGTSVGQGANPEVMLRISKDAGKTWGNQSVRSIGAEGAYQTRVFWTRLGSSQTSWVPEIVVTDPVPVRITSASIVGRGLPAQKAAA